MTDAVRKLLAQYPKDNFRTEPLAGDIEKLWLVDPLNHESIFLPILRELRQSSAPHLSIEFASTTSPDGKVHYQRARTPQSGCLYRVDDGIECMTEFEG